MTLYTGGFSRFVAFTAAPIATGWNESRRAGFAPAEKPCLCTAHKISYVILWGIALWSPSYFAGSCGGAPIAVISQYIEQQQTLNS